MTTEKRPGLHQPIGSVIWRIITSPESMIGILAVGVIICLMAGCIPQIPSTFLDNPTQISTWLNSIPTPWYGYLNSWHSAGLTALANSRLVMVYLIVLIFLCVVHTILAFNPSWNTPKNLIRLDLNCDVIETATAQIRLSFSAQQLTINSSVTASYRTASNLAKLRWYWLAMTCGVVLVSVSVLGAGAIGNLKVIDVSRGESLPIPGASDATLILDKLARSPNDAVTSISYWHTSSGGQQIVLARGKPAVYNHHVLYQIDEGPAITLSSADTQGELLDIMINPADNALEHSMSLHFIRGEQEQFIDLPDRGLLLRLVNNPSLPSQGISERAVVFQIYETKSNDLLFQTVLVNNSVVIFRDLSFTVSLDDYVVIKVQSIFWDWMALIGLVSLAAGIAGVCCIPQRQIWFGVTHLAEGPLYTIWFREQDQDRLWLKRIFVDLQGRTDASL